MIKTLQYNLKHKRQSNHLKDKTLTITEHPGKTQGVFIIITQRELFSTQFNTHIQK